MIIFFEAVLGLVAGGALAALLKSISRPGIVNLLVNYTGKARSQDEDVL